MGLSCCSRPSPSLKRLPVAAREKVKALAVFHGVANVGVMALVLEVGPEEALDLGQQLVDVGLADADGDYLLLDPALGAALAVVTERGKPVLCSSSGSCIAAKIG